MDRSLSTVVGKKKRTGSIKDGSLPQQDANTSLP